MVPVCPDGIEGWGGRALLSAIAGRKVVAGPGGDQVERGHEGLSAFGQLVGNGKFVSRSSVA